MAIKSTSTSENGMRQAAELLLHYLRLQVELQRQSQETFILQAQNGHVLIFQLRISCSVIILLKMFFFY